MKTRALLLLLSIGAASIHIHAAETLSVIPDSAQGLGIAGGRFANLRDASAVRTSPANILSIEQSELLINTAAWYGDLRLNANNGDHVRMSRPWVFPASMYAVFPILPGKVAFGIGVTTPYGVATIYPNNMSTVSGMRYALPYESNLLAADITPAIAFKVSDSLSIALGMEIMYSDLKIKQFYKWSNVIPGAAEGDIQCHGQGWGLGAYTGVNWEIAKGHRLAIIGRLPLRVKYKGEFTATNIPVGAAASPTSEFNSDINFPGSIAVGYGIDITDQWTVGFDFKWTNNSATNDLPLNIGANQALLGGQDRSVFNWRDSIDLGFGSTYAFNESWSLRCGYLFSENSQPSNTFSPVVSTSDRSIFSLGVGWRGKTRSVDLTYAFVYNPTRTISGATNATGAAQPLFDGNYKHQWQVLSFSITQRF